MNLKKSLLCLSVITSAALIQFSASANGSGNNSSALHSAAKDASSATAANDCSSDEYIASVYQSIDFGKSAKLNAEVFAKAMRGYLNLQSAGKLSSIKNMLTIADFTLASTAARLWVIDLKAKKVLYNTYVAHGQGSGDNFATTFSNTDGTHASSLGFYVTSDCYNGQHGNSLRLNGMDRGFNDAALARGIVMHAADYVSNSNIAGQGRLGRSWGCPAVAPELAQPIINTIKGGTCLFIYYPQTSYMKTAYWMNKKVEAVPANGNKMQLADVKSEGSTTNRL